MLLYVMLLLGSIAFRALPTTADDGCGGDIIAVNSGEIPCPEFQFDSHWGEVYTWNIIAPPQHKIKFRINRLELFFTSSVTFTSILSDGTEEIEGNFDVYISHPDAITSKENVLRIELGIRHSSTNFRGIYKVIKDPAATTTTAAPKATLSTSEDVLKRSESSKSRNVHWLLHRVKRRGSLELPRAVLALFLAKPEYFAPGNDIGAKMRDRLTIQVLGQISRNSTIRSQELALYVQALLVTCEDPRNFFGRDFVSQLRGMVDRPSDFVNPFEVFALCNAGGNVTVKDVERVSRAFDSQHRPFWTDVQALATMALQCLSRRGVTVDERKVRDMQDELKKRQFKNGTVDNLATTGLVLQALRGNGSSVDFLNLTSALDVILRAQGEDGSWGGSVRNSFYLLPALSERSLLDIGHAHCPKTTESEEESLARLQESAGGKKWVVQYSVWIGGDVDLGRTWRLRVDRKVTFYDVLEMVSKLDNRHNVTYQVVDGKPYVRSLLGREDDPELGLFWFAHLRPSSSTQPPTLLDSSPVDVQVAPNQELIMWYKPNPWRNGSG